MGLDLETTLANLSPEKQEDILDQLDIATAEEYKKKGYGLQVNPSVPEHKEYVPTTLEPLPAQPQPTQPTQHYADPLPNDPPEPDDTPGKFTLAALIAAGLLGTLVLFVLAAALALASPIAGVAMLALSGVPLIVALLYTVRLTHTK